MSKADELAVKYCAKCKNKSCSVPCSDVLILLFINCQASPHQAQEMMKNARQRVGI